MLTAVRCRLATGIRGTPPWETNHGQSGLLGLRHRALQEQASHELPSPTMPPLQGTQGL